VIHQQKPLRTISLNFDEADDIGQLRKAYELGSDAVSFDLEDHVPQAKLPEARTNLRQVLRECGQRTPTFVRLNKIDNPEIIADLDGIICPELFGVMLPKVEHPNDVIICDRLLDLYEARNGVERGQILILPLLETALGNRFAYEIASASPRVAYQGGMISRNGDPAISIGFEWTRELRETLYLRQKGQMDAKAAGVKWTMSGNWNPVHDLEGLERFAVESRQIGYTGMICMPVPEHVELINRVFTPTQEEIDYWAEIIPLIDAVETDVFVGGEPLPPNKAKWGRKKLVLAEHFGITPSPDRKKLTAEHVGGMSLHTASMTNEVPTIPTWTGERVP
jgi:citrate lyase subunit beta/citryl-CoA lyase